MTWHLNANTQITVSLWIDEAALDLHIGDDVYLLSDLDGIDMRDAARYIVSDDSEIKHNETQLFALHFINDSDIVLEAKDSAKRQFWLRYITKMALKAKALKKNVVRITREEAIEVENDADLRQIFGGDRNMLSLEFGEKRQGQNKNSNRQKQKQVQLEIAAVLENANVKDLNEILADNEALQTKQSESNEIDNNALVGLPKLPKQPDRKTSVAAKMKKGIRKRVSLLRGKNNVAENRQDPYGTFADFGDEQNGNNVPLKRKSITARLKDTVLRRKKKSQQQNSEFEIGPELSDELFF